MAFSPDGTKRSRLGATTTRSCGTSRAERRRRLEKHFGSVADARFSPDGRWIVTAGPKTAGLWTVADGRFAGYLRGPESLLTAAAFGPDSRTIVTREESGDVRRYRCECAAGWTSGRSLATARLSATGRALTDEERARYLG